MIYIYLSHKICILVNNANHNIIHWFCPPVCADSQPAVASRLSSLQLDNHGIAIGPVKQLFSVKLPFFTYLSV